VRDGREGDELEPLRRAWEELRAPEPAPERSPADAAERAALEWVRAAWGRVDPPAPARRFFPRPAPAAAPERRWAWIAAAAAAGIAGLWLALAPVDEGPPELGIARPELPGGEPAVPEEQPTAPKVEVAHVTSDRMELRSGFVRLILLTGRAGAAAARSDDG
jgi:hypothetical protein